MMALLLHNVRAFPDGQPAEPSDRLLLRLQPRLRRYVTGMNAPKMFTGYLYLRSEVDDLERFGHFPWSHATTSGKFAGSAP